MLNRRGLITGLISLAAAPAIVRASSLMPVKVIKTLTPQEIINLVLSGSYDFDPIDYLKAMKAMNEIIAKWGGPWSLLPIN